jgi:hypothetical protein
MYRQTDHLINPMEAWGCYFCSILALSEKVSGYHYPAKEVLSIWSKSGHDGDVDMEATVLDPQGLCDDLKGNLKFLRREGASYLCKQGEYEILEYFNPKTGVIHFVLGNGRGGCEWDPWENSRTVRDGYVRSKRIYGVKS